MIFISVAAAAFAVWLIFFGGAEQLEDSWLTALLHVPGMTATEIKVWAFLALVTTGISAIFL